MNVKYFPKDHRIGGIGRVNKAKKYAKFNIFLHAQKFDQKVLIKMQLGAWVINKTVPFLIRNTILDPAGTNINYAIKKITFKILINIHLPFSISRDNTAISYRVALLENIIFLPEEIRLIKTR